MNIENLLKKMTIKEKIAQLTQVSFSPDRIDEICERLKREPIGSMILSSSSTAGNAEKDSINCDVIDKFQKISMENHGIPMLFGRDVIHGHHIVWPIPLGMSAAFNPELIEESYRCISEESRNDGINWTFAPMLDVSRDPRWGRIIESTGEDPYVGEQMAKAVVNGFQGRNEKLDMAACAKHFIGYGASEGGRDYQRTEISDYSLRNYYLRAFKSAVDSGVATVMNSFNEINGQPTASSRYLLNDVLRGELGFEGFVVSDWSAIIQLINQGVAADGKEAAELSINAGLDVDMVDDELYYKHIETLIEEGKVSMETLDNAVRRVLLVKNKMGLFENPYTKINDYSKEKHRESAKKTAVESMVMLKNNNALPLSTDEKICVMGDISLNKRTILGSWTLDYDIDESVTVFDAINNATQNAFYYDYNSPEGNVLRRAYTTDTAIVVIGESASLTGEANSIANIELSESQKEMIRFARKRFKKVVGLFAFGRPRAFEDVVDDLDAIIYLWHSGSQTGNAIADILFGKASPSGRLPVTIPRTTGQIPLFYNLPPAGRSSYGYYGQTGSLHYLDVDSTPLYHFGYGLTYTNFRYGEIHTNSEKLTLNEIQNGKYFEITIEVENVGDFDAKEVVQCYVRDCVSSLTRPIRELKGFKKVFIEKGKKSTTTFKIGYEELGYFRNDGKYAVETGAFRIYIGKDCVDSKFIEVEVI